MIIVVHIYLWGELVTVVEVAAGGGNKNLQVVFKNCAPFTNCISKINNALIDNAEHIHVVMR